ncbi:sialidase family protein [Larkinella bovis]|uniref:Sialidase family protein n=1 Tax=Larkinella bovis TaxID=683041 RepID=A0ABW0IIN6_9BACT
MNSSIKHLFLLLTFLTGLTTAYGRKKDDGPVVTKIWDQATHSAFTDLIRFKGAFYCSFREGSGHIPGTDGKVRILKSTTGKDWESVALLEKEGIDLRDPKLSITPNGRLMIIIGGSIYQQGKLLGRTPHVAFSDKTGLKFSVPEKVNVDPSIVSWGDWIWRVTWHKGTGYAIDYQIGPQERNGPTAMYLLKTKDGKSFEKVSKLDVDGFPNEATVRFDQHDSLFVLIRREIGDKVGMLAKSAAPYTNWNFQRLTMRLGGPNFLFLNDQQLVMGTRSYETVPNTAFFLGDKNGKFRKIFKLPSSGDNSYPGMVLHEGTLYISYYSSHEGKASIYFTQVPVSQLMALNKAPDILPSKPIWNSSPHSAFTDLLRFNGKFYCTFREGLGHSPVHTKPGESSDGTIRVIASVDGEKWESQALIKEPGIDLRDPKLAITPDGRLMITCGGSDYVDNKLMEWHTRVMFSKDGQQWTSPMRVRGIPSNNWFFRITWNGPIGYVASNICETDPKTGQVNTKNRKLILYKTVDGVNYQVVSNDFNPSPEGCEATVKFRADSSLVILIRNAGGNSTAGFLAFAKPPYQKFEVVQIDHGMGGQNFFELTDNRWLVVTREYPYERPPTRTGTATVMLQVDENGIFQRLYELPSGGDTSYPGLLIHEDKLWISYYSSHEGKSSIYLSVIPMAQLKDRIQSLLTLK